MFILEWVQSVSHFLILYAHGLSAVHGLQPHKQHRGTGQEVQIRYGVLIMEGDHLD